jgi:hypothetical protein
MPPAKGRARGAGAKSNQSAKQNSGIKLTLAIRESQSPESLQGFQTSHCTNLDDSINIFEEIFPTKYRGKSVNLDTNRSLQSFQPSAEHPNVGVIAYEESGVQKQSEVYKKTIALIDPYNFMRNNERPTEPFFWQFQSGDVLSPENQGYIDCVASSLVSQLIKSYNSPHFCDFFGCFRGRADVFHYNLEDDIEDFRYTHWFWKAIDAGEFGLRVIEKETGKQLSMAEIQSVLRPDVEFLSDDEDEDEDDSSVTSDSRLDSCSSSSLGAETLCSQDDENQSLDCSELEEASLPSADGSVHIRRDRHRGYTASAYSTESDTSDGSFTEDYSIHAELRGMPVVCMFLEKQSGTLDEFLEQSNYAPIKTVEQQQIWAAWLFQICAALTQVQAGLHLTHNDLHTNNILWKKTDKEYLFYKDTKGRQWRVPTYGYIFTIIDYGRAIFTLSGFTCVSSDYNDGHDAAGMYNFGPIEDEDLPRVHPNRSFDLCRLSCSLLRALYPLNPDEMKQGAIITKEGSSVVRETAHPVFNILWNWLKSKQGHNVLETPDGREKYPGFELYSVIAANVTNAVPDVQLGKSVFQSFVLKTVPTLPAGSSWIQIPV